MTGDAKGVLTIKTIIVVAIALCMAYAQARPAIYEAFALVIADTAINITAMLCL